MGKQIKAEIPRQWLDASYALNPREILSLDKIVYGVVRNRAIAQKWFPTVPIKKGMRTHELSIAIELSEPKFDGNFMTEDLDQVRKQEVTYHLVPMHKDYVLDMIDLDASRNNDYYNTKIDELNIREATKTIADYKERVLWNGYSIKNRAQTGAHPQGTLNTGVSSLISPDSELPDTQNTFNAAGDNAGINSAGDGILSISAAAKSLIPDKYFGPYVFVMSTHVYAQLFGNVNTTTHMTDIQMMYAMVDLAGNRILEGMDISPYLTAAAESGDTGSMFMFQRKTPDGEPTAVILESYPVSHYPTQQNDLGIKGKVLWMGCAAVLRAAAFTLETSVDLEA